MKLLVTGAAGFIGSNFVHYLLKNHPQDQITGLDLLTYAGRLESLKDVMQSPNFSFVQADIADADSVDRLFAERGFDYVVNFAAETHVDRSIREPGVFLRSNVEGVRVLMDACLKHHAGRFHQVSTDEVYGDLPLNGTVQPFDEDAPLRPSNPYSASKASADLLALAYRRTYRLPLTISRCSNNYGPYQFPEKLIPLVILRALEGKSIPIYGTGENRRDWIHVLDHCAAVDRILREGKNGEIYHISAQQELENLAVVKMILRELGCSEGLIEFVADRPGHDLRYAISAKKIAHELNWMPSVPFEQGLRSTIEFYKSHPDW